MFKSNGGFTLVELIVVIAILAILAGITVPAYTGYINKANDSAADVELRTVYIAAMAACAHEGSNVSSIQVSSEGKVTITPTVSDPDIESNYATFYEGSEASLKAALAKHSKFSGGATWSNGEWKAG